MILKTSQLMDHSISFLLSQIYGQFKPVATEGVSRDRSLHQPEHRLLISKPSCLKSPDHRLKLVVHQEGHSPRCWSRTPRRSIDNLLFPDHSNGSYVAGVVLPRVQRTWAWSDLLVAFCEDREQSDKQDHTLLCDEPLNLGCFQSGS